MPKGSALGRSAQILLSFLVLSHEMRHLGAYSLFSLLRWFSLKKAVSSVDVEELLLCKQEVNLQFLTFIKVEDQSGTRQRLQFIRHLPTWGDVPAKSKVCISYQAHTESYEWTLVLERSFLIISFTAKKEDKKRNRLASHCCRQLSSVHNPPSLHSFLDSFSTALNSKCDITR